MDIPPIPRRLPEPWFKEYPGVETDDHTECDKSPNKQHRYLFETAADVSTLQCLYCWKVADPALPANKERGNHD